MVCPECGKWAPMDRETGYDADEVCQDCRSLLEEIELAEQCLTGFFREQFDLDDESIALLIEAIEGERAH